MENLEKSSLHGEEEKLENAVEEKKHEVKELEDVLGREVEELRELEEELEEKKHEEPPHHEHFHIFVNGVRYGHEDGVKHVMTGNQIIELVPVDPPSNADLTREGSDVHLSHEEPIHLKDGERFEVIRKSVTAGLPVK